MKLPLAIVITICLTSVIVLQSCQSQMSAATGVTKSNLPSLPPPPFGYIGKGTGRPTRPDSVAADDVNATLPAVERKFGYIVLTSVDHHTTRIPNLMSTWGQHANILFIASDALDARYPLIIDLKEKGKRSLGKKAMKMMEMTCDQVESGKLDYVVMADDDTYLVTPNLEYVFSQVDPDVPGYYGYSLTHTKVPFIGGGGGIVFSRGTMKEVCAAAKSRGKAFNKCQWEQCEGLPGDIAISLCMQHVKVPAVHIDGFHPFPVHEMINEPKNWCTATWWIPKHLKCPPVPRAISFHYLAQERWKEYYYWTFRFQRERDAKQYSTAHP